MKIISKVQKEVDEITDVICNKCGNSCKTSVVPGGFNGLIEAIVHGGYDSTHLEDGDQHCFSLCEACLSELFKSFKHPSLVYNSLFTEDWIPEAIIVVRHDLKKEEFDEYTEKLKSLTDGLEFEPMHGILMWTVRGSVYQIGCLKDAKILEDAGFVIAENSTFYPINN